MSGFKGTPVSQTIWAVTAAASLGAAFLSPSSAWGLGAKSLSRLELWRIPTSLFVFSSTSETLFGLYFIWSFRELERRFGSRKFASKIFFISMFATALQLFSIFLLPSSVTFASGPYPLIFGLFPYFLSEMSSPARFKLFAYPISDNTFSHLLALQLLFSAYPSSLFASASALFSGLLFRTKRLPLHSLRLPAWLFPSTNPFRSKPSSRPSSSSPQISEQHVQTLVSMGFSEQDSRQALRHARGDLQAATNHLLG